MAETQWFPIGRDDSSGWRLDVVSLITILGESLMSRHIQPLSASKLSLLPRIIPAPQSFLGSTRNSRLPSQPADVCGVYSGTLVRELNYFANILLPIENMKRFDVAVWEIELSDRSKTQDPNRDALIPPRAYSPLNILTVLSSLLMLGAFVLAIALQDGTAALALLAIACASILIGIASYWRPKLASRPTDALVPQGDIVIRTREAAFAIIRCSDDIARELFIGSEECNYLVGKQWFKVLVGISLSLITISVVLLGNCGWIMQAVIAVIYIALNILYWIASLLPQKLLWDLSRYECRLVTPERFTAPSKSEKGKSLPSYTQSLWFAIQATKRVGWVTLSEAAPRTTVWETWIRLAHANCHDPTWDSITEKDRLMKQATFEESQASVPLPAPSGGA